MKPFKTVYLAKSEYLAELCQELGETEPDLIENLVFSHQEKKDLVFACDIWLTPHIVSFQSISEASRILKKAGRFWLHYPITQIRRATLISENLRQLPELIHPFPLQKEILPIGCFSLLDQHTLLYCATRSKKPPLGDFNFVEDKINPPNRAYLKLWEALSLCDYFPKEGERALDLGASPGGWTYVMQSLKTEVLAIDKALLDPRIAQLKGVRYLKQSAFAFEPETLQESFDWVLCDVACYPERTLDLARRWIASKKAQHLIFTIKLQGKTDWSMIRAFQTIPGGRVMHLYHNKHEVTFFWSKDKPAGDAAEFF